jgi:uncharacterized protein (TIGR02246 family)
MRFLVACLFAFMLSACATPAGRDTTDAAVKEVLAATDAWRAAYDSRDPARIAAMYGQGAVFWGTTMKTVATTPEAIKEYFKDAAARPDARVAFTDQHVRVYGDVAFNSGAYTFTDKREGRDIANPSRFSMVFKRQGAAWVLVHHHSSRVP